MRSRRATLWKWGEGRESRSKGLHFAVCTGLAAPMRGRQYASHLRTPVRPYHRDSTLACARFDLGAVAPAQEAPAFAATRKSGLRSTFEPSVDLATGAACCSTSFASPISLLRLAQETVGCALGPWDKRLSASVAKRWMSTTGSLANGVLRNMYLQKSSRLKFFCDRLRGRRRGRQGGAVGATLVETDLGCYFCHVGGRSTAAAVSPPPRLDRCHGRARTDLASSHALPPRRPAPPSYPDLAVSPLVSPLP